MATVRRGKEGEQYILPTLENEVAERAKIVRRRLLAPLFTNLDKDIYVATDKLPNRILAMLMARQSRSEIRDARDIVVDEFLEIPELGLVELLGSLEAEYRKFLKEVKAGKMTTRIIDGFGDDSVREDASAYVMVQNASILATTFGITHPLLTRIEASTRYINWGKKENGRYLYKQLDFEGSDEAKKVYEGAMELCFGVYGELWQPIWDYVVANNPREEGVSEESYNVAVHGKVCDNLKGLLPLSALTNFGVHANYRSLSEQIIALRASENAEMREMGDEMAVELFKVNPEFIAMVDNDHGKKWTEQKQAQAEYLAERVALGGLAKEGNRRPGIDLLKVSTRNFPFTVARAYINSQNPGLDKGAVNRMAEQMVKTGQLEKMLLELGQLRTNRRHELPDFLREITVKIRFRQISLGSLKDLFRHRRILWRTQPDFSGQNGHHIPKDIAAMGGAVLEKYSLTQRMMGEVVTWMRTNVGEEKARYCLTQGMLTTFDIHCDLLEAYWISELRSIASGFEEYRWFAQDLWRTLVRKIPGLASLGTFTNMNEYSLGRVREAVRQDLKGR